MISYKKNGELALDKKRSIYNEKNGQIYKVEDVKIILKDEIPFIISKYNKLEKAQPYYELEYWSLVPKSEEKTIIIPNVGDEKYAVSTDRLKITSKTDSVNKLFIMYLKEAISPSSVILTTNQARLKNLFSKLIKHEEIPLSWKHIDEILDYISLNKDDFLNWMITMNGQTAIRKYIKVED